MPWIRAMPLQAVEMRRADLHGVEAHAGGNAAQAADDVGHVGAVAATGPVVERVGIRRLGGLGGAGQSAPTKSYAADHLRGREGARAR